jgi:hypothetical protein
MISFITYTVLTYCSIKFVLWLYNINKPEDQVNEYSIIKIAPVISNKKVDILLKDIKGIKFIHDAKLKSIYKIYKKHLTVRVNYVEHDML